MLTQDAQFSYLYTNYSAGVTSIVVTNSTSFTDNCYILLEGIGSETAEIIKVSTVTGSTHTLTLDTASKFAHTESSKVTIIPYNRVKFYHTATAVFATSELIGYVNVNPAEIYSIGSDASNDTGYGWFTFFNSTTSTASDESNPVPYEGFSGDSVSTLISKVFSTLSDSERKIISEDDMLGWIQEGYDITTDKLNLVTREITVSDELTLSVVSGTQEYALSDRFSDLVYLRTYDASNTASTNRIEEIAIRDIPEYLSSGASDTKYYLRMSAGVSYVGFVPTPISSATYKYRCRLQADVLDSYSDILALPNSSFYAVRDYALSKAYEKLQDGRMGQSRQLFNEGINSMKEVSIKRSDTLDSWGIEKSSWV